MRRLASRALLSAVALAAVAPTPAVGQLNTTYRIAALHVSNGETAWRSDNQFPIDWERSPGDSRDLPTEIAYRIENEEGEAVGAVEALPIARESFRVSIPGGEPAAGAYRLLAWLRKGEQFGPSASVTLRFDATRPSAVRPLVDDGWLRTGSAAELRIEHPGSPRPPSGIRGYAVELDQGSGSEPCGARPTCTAAETDLDGGEDDDTTLLGPLAEGTTVVRVVAVSGTGMRSAHAEAATLHVDGTPPAVRLSGAPAGWSSHPLELVATASDRLSGMDPADPGGPATTIAVDGEPPTVALGPRVTTTVHGSGVHEVTAFARDAVGNTGAADPDAAYLKVRIDEAAPRVAFTVFQDPDRPERIVAFVDDALSGPSPSRGTIELRPAGSNLPFEPLATTVAGERLLATWDSDSYGQGTYEFRAIGYDAAGNRSETSRRADGAAMLLANPVKVPTRLAVGFGGRIFLAHRCRRRATGLSCESREIADFASRPAGTRVAYGRGVPLGGRLTSAAGTPLPGRTVTITETFAAGALSARRETTAVTGEDGVFLAHLGPGPSRRVTIAFPGDARLTRTAGRELQLAVRSGLHLRASASTAKVGGAPFAFEGRLGRRATTVPLGGVAVELEFRVAGLPWGEFRSVRTDPRGRFRYPYAFSDDDSRGIRFQFRAHVAPQAGWPYDEAYSRPVAVTGT